MLHCGRRLGIPSNILRERIIFLYIMAVTRICKLWNNIINKDYEVFILGSVRLVYHKTQVKSVWNVKR